MLLPNLAGLFHLFLLPDLVTLSFPSKLVVSSDSPGNLLYVGVCTGECTSAKPQPSFSVPLSCVQGYSIWWGTLVSHTHTHACLYKGLVRPFVNLVLGMRWGILRMLQDWWDPVHVLG